MKKVSLLVALVVALTGMSAISAQDGKSYTLSTMLVVEPGHSATVSIVDGLLKVENNTKPEVPAIVNSSPDWLKYELELAFSKLAKSPDRVGKDAYIALANIDGTEAIVLSSIGKKPYILGLPGYKDLSAMLPSNIDPTARIAIADVDTDGNLDLVVCPKIKGYYYLLGPDFAVSTKTGNITINPDDAKKPLYPIGLPDGSVKLVTEPKEFGFWDASGSFKPCKQDNFVMPLPVAYGVMTSQGLFYIDSNGDLRLFDVRLTSVNNETPSGFSSKTEKGLPSFDSEAHLAFDKNKIYAGLLDGVLKSMEYTKTGWNIQSEKTSLGFGTKLSVQIADGNLYYIDSKSKNIKLAKGPNWTKAEKLNVTTDAPFAAADFNNDKKTDLAVISGNKVSILAGPDFKTSSKTIEEWIERKKNDKETEKVSLIDNGCSLAFADFNFDGKADLLVGLRDGRILTYTGPKFEKADAFDWLDVGDFAAPQFGDVDLDGKADLIVSNVDGRLFCYRKVGEIWQEWKSWSFIPTPSQAVATDYFNSYMHDAPLVQWKNDPETVNAYVSQLENCQPKMFDEIAFVIAQTSPEILRTMSRMGQADIVTRNAKTIYEYAPMLPYLKLVEKPDYTTISYKVAGKEVELPRDDYYWYVVHPRILFELPIGIDCSWWDKSAQERGMGIEDWWKHEENLYLAKEKAVFWREEYKTDKTYGESIIEAAKKSNTYEEAMKNVFWLKGIGKDRLFVFGYLTNDLFPWQIYKKHYGSCGENSIVFASMARAALLPCYVAIDQGEDHQWNEVWYPDGWRHVEPSSEQLSWDDPGGSSEGRDHKAKTVSAVVGWRGDDYMFPTTTTVHNPEPGYTKNQKGYTDTADVSFKILDSQDKPIEGGLVIIRTGWNNSNNVSIWDYTNINGITRFDLGYEPYYVIDVVTPYGITGLSRFVVKELEKYEVTLKVPGKSTKISNPLYNEPTQTGTNVLFESIQDEQRPLNFRTSRGYRLGGYLFETYGHHGPLFYRQPVIATPATVKIGSSNYSVSQGRGVSLSEGQSMVITNDSLFTYKAVKIKVSIPVKEYKLSITAKPDKSEVTSGNSFVVSGNIDHSTPLSKFEYSWDGKAWSNVEIPHGKWFNSFDLKIETGANGPMSPGNKTLTMRCSTSTSEGMKSNEIVLPIKILSTSSFLNQPLSQDGPDSVADSKWKLVDFTIPEGEKYLLIQTTTEFAGLDLDMFLYLDSNGNGKVDKNEEIANSAGGSAFERILLNNPKSGPYILLIHGYSVPDPDTRFDLKMSVAPTW
jgi:hypothetical protein